MADNALKTPLSQSIGGYADQRANAFTHTQAKGMPCRVVKVEKDILTIAFEGQNNIWTMPQVKIPQAFSPYGRDPTQVGDKGTAHPGDFNLGGISGLGGGPSDWTPRGNLTPLVFHPTSKVNSETRDYDQYTGAGGPNGMKFLQKANQPKDNQQPPGTPNPQLLKRMLGWGSRSRRMWDSRPRATPPSSQQKDERSFMELDKSGVVTHSSKTGKHQVTVDEGGSKITLKVPVSGSTAWVGGTGKQSSLYGPFIVATPMGLMITCNSQGKWQKQDD
jgi:hypothetical protein